MGRTEHADEARPVLPSSALLGRRGRAAVIPLTGLIGAPLLIASSVAVARRPSY